MVASRIGPKRATLFGLSSFCAALMPTQVGYQDLAALIARQPAVSERWREHVIASPFGTIHAATFSFTRPVGTGMPEPLGYQLANFDPRSLDVTGAIMDVSPIEQPPAEIDYPTVNRALKGDRLPVNVPPEAEPEPLPQLQPVEAQPEPPLQLQPVEAQPEPPPQLQPVEAQPEPPPQSQPVEAQPEPPPQSQPVEAQPERPPQLQPVEAQPEPLPQLRPVEAQPEPPLQLQPVEVQPEPAPSPAVPAASPQIQPAKQAAPAGGAPPDLEASAVADTAAAVTDNLTKPGPQAATPDQPDSAGDPEGLEDEALVADAPPDISDAPAIDPLAAAHSYVASLSFFDGNQATRSAQVYFGTGALGAPRGLEQWAPGAEPTPVAPATVALATADPDIKLAALTPAAPEKDPAGETVVSKGEIQSEINRPQSPADRLGLSGKTRAKAEKCLADAIYFESRGEPVRGQMAVAQVVMNRVFSGFYPSTVCGVVYQNAHRHLACQFTFACDGIRDRVTEPEMWVQAKRIAKDTLDGAVWLPEVGHATHYHAYWVRPSWVHEMKKMYKLGVHTFYRPRAWGSGADEPAWGKLPATAPMPKADAGKDAPSVKL